MPIQHAIWTVSDSPKSLATTRLPSEQLLEDMIEKDPRILSEQWMIIGRQIITPMGGRLDLLAIAPDASLVLIELKRDKTPLDIVAQAFDYASWVEKLEPDQISKIYRDYSGDKTLDQAFKDRFGSELDEEALNQSHQIILCAAELDPATERIVTYLNDKDIPVNVLFFQFFQHGEAQLLSRTWLINPAETQENVTFTSGTKRACEPMERRVLRLLRPRTGPQLGRSPRIRLLLRRGAAPGIARPSICFRKAISSGCASPRKAASAWAASNRLSCKPTTSLSKPRTVPFPPSMFSKRLTTTAPMPTIPRKPNTSSK